MRTGSEFLVKVKELGAASKSEIVRASGDVSAKQVGGERHHFTVSVQGHGNLLFAKVYPAQLGRQRRGSGKSRRSHG